MKIGGNRCRQGDSGKVSVKYAQSIERMPFRPELLNHSLFKVQKKTKLVQPLTVQPQPPFVGFVVSLFHRLRSRRPVTHFTGAAREKEKIYIIYYMILYDSERNDIRFAAKISSGL